MEDNTEIHPLARAGSKSGKIVFRGFNGKEHSFSTCINDLSGDRMSWFDLSAPVINDEKWTKSVFKDIRAQEAEVISVIGDY